MRTIFTKQDLVQLLTSNGSQDNGSILCRVNAVQLTISKPTPYIKRQLPLQHCSNSMVLNMAF